MRIGMMADAYKPHVSGITNYINLSKNYLERAGHEVFVFTFGDEQIDDDPNVIKSPGLPLVDSGYYVSFRYSQKAQKLLRTMDVVHVHHPFLSGRLALRYCKTTRIPIIFTNHTRYDLYAQAYFPSIPDGVGETFLKAYLPSFCHSVDQVIAPSHGMEKVLQRLGVDDPIIVIPNGVDLTPFSNAADSAEKIKLGFNEDDFVFIYAGRLGPEKNLPFLLRSFNGAAQAYDNLKLLIVGDGPEGENILDLIRFMGISSKVKCTGMVPYHEIPKYLASADAFVTASVTEVHPLTIIEAMASGLPILGIDSPGIGDTIDDGQNGYLIPEEDMAAFTAKLVRLITDHQTREKLGESARKSSEIYAIERTTSLMEEQYQKVIKKKIGEVHGIKASILQFMDKLRK